MELVEGGRILAARHQAAPPKVPEGSVAADADAGTVKPTNGQRYE
jgi:hypothetical protein